MARVLFYSLIFPPDGVSTAQIMGELAIDLAKAGHTVSAVTTEPHYNVDVLASAAQPMTPAWGGRILRSSLRGIPVIHTRMAPKSRGIRARMTGWLKFHFLGFFAALRFVRQPQVIIVPSPLLSGGVVGWMIGVLTGAKYIYNVQELYPDLGIQMGKLRNPVAIAILKAMERFVYRTSAAITVITRGMEQKLIARGVPAEKVHYIPNFVDANDLQPLPRSNAFSREHDLDGKFTVTYAGNMGYAQGLDVVIEAARLLDEADRDVLLLFVGGGVARQGLEEQARRLGLKNVRFIAHQPYERVPEIYAASDLSIVSLVDTIGADAIPSKVYRIMACSRPVLAIASPTSELAETIRESGAGVVVRPEAKAIADTIRNYARQSAEERLRAGEKGRAYVLEHVSREMITNRYDQLVSAIAGDARK